MISPTHSGLQSLLSGFEFGADGIWSSDLPDGNQEPERRLREEVAAKCPGNYLREIAMHHSLPVMDHEVDRFLAFMPHNALILDIGGCWGWHWRRLAMTRPDVGVLIADFVRANLTHAQKVLGPLVGTQVELMHADATTLPFSDADVASAAFDGVWTVQVFQHIPDFARACHEARRVLKRGGRFINYSLHATPLNRTVYWLLDKSFHTEGMVKNQYYLTRANDRQRQIVADIFGGEVTERYTECLFHPDLKFTFTGRLCSLIGQFDARLGNVPWLGRRIARQRSFEAIKV